MFPEVTDQEWNDWKWQIRNRVVNLEQLRKYIALTPEGRGVHQSLTRMAITPYYLSLIDPDDPDCLRETGHPTKSVPFRG